MLILQVRQTKPITATYSRSFTLMREGPLTVTSVYDDVTAMGPEDCWTLMDGTCSGSHGGTPYSGSPGNNYKKKIVGTFNVSLPSLPSKKMLFLP